MVRAQLPEDVVSANETRIPGLKAEHAIIYPACRARPGGSDAAFYEAFNRLLKEYQVCVKGHPGATFHMVLTVEPAAGEGQ